jgi:hypothetical protein
MRGEERAKAWLAQGRSFQDILVELSKIQEIFEMFGADYAVAYVVALVEALKERI